MTPPYLVQRLDAEGFWCNVTEGGTVRQVWKLAQAEANESRVEHRVVCGPRRAEARYFQPTLKRDQAS